MSVWFIDSWPFSSINILFTASDLRVNFCVWHSRAAQTVVVYQKKIPKFASKDVIHYNINWLRIWNYNWSCHGSFALNKLPTTIIYNDNSSVCVLLNLTSVCISGWKSNNKTGAPQTISYNLEVHLSQFITITLAIHKGNKIKLKLAWVFLYYFHLHDFWSFKCVSAIIHWLLLLQSCGQSDNYSSTIHKIVSLYLWFIYKCGRTWLRALTQLKLTQSVVGMCGIWSQ